MGLWLNWNSLGSSLTWFCGERSKVLRSLFRTECKLVKGILNWSLGFFFWLLHFLVEVKPVLSFNHCHAIQLYSSLCKYSLYWGWSSSVSFWLLPLKHRSVQQRISLYITLVTFVHVLLPSAVCTHKHSQLIFILCLKDFDFVHRRGSGVREREKKNHRNKTTNHYNNLSRTTIRNKCLIIILI